MSQPHWLTGETLDDNATPWVLGINKSYFMLGMKSAGMFSGPKFSRQRSIFEGLQQIPESR